ncbi:MAG: hypothetical protein ACI4R8_04990 [Candidatus Caccovivens sp.]
MKKKFLSVVAGIVVAIVGGIALSACGQMSNDFITKAGSVELGGVNFSNSANLSIDYCGENKYQANGDVSVMSATQADAFWAGTAKEGDNYIILSVKFNVGSTIVYGFDVEGANFENPDGTTVKRYTNNTENNDTLEIILRVNSEKETFKVVDTEKDADAVTYTVDMSKLNYKTQG